MVKDMNDNNVLIIFVSTTYQKSNSQSRFLTISLMIIYKFHGVFCVMHVQLIVIDDLLGVFL